MFVCVHLGNHTARRGCLGKLGAFSMNQRAYSMSILTSLSHSNYIFYCLFCVWMFCLLVCASCARLVPEKDRRRCHIPLGQELEMSVSHHVGAVSWTHVLWKSIQHSLLLSQLSNSCLIVLTTAVYAVSFEISNFESSEIVLSSQHCTVRLGS